MHKLMPLPAVVPLMALAALALSAVHAAEPEPEIKRPGATAQAVNALHTLRNIPEACVRIEGRFTGDAAAPYAMNAERRERCNPRALYVDAAKAAPSPESGWILNDLLRVPRAGGPGCEAVVKIWRKAGDAAPPDLDPQGRSRLYLDKPQAAKAAPMFSAVLEPPASCG